MGTTEKRTDDHETPVVLVFDDDADALNYASILFQDVGYQVRHARAQEEFEAQLGERPNLLVLDLMLKGTDGIQMLDRLAQHRAHQPIILASSCDRRILQSVEAMGAMHGLNMLGSLRKPYRKSDVLAILARDDQTAVPRLSRDDLQRSLETGRILPFYQPQIDLLKMRVCRLETLARLRDPALGDIPASALFRLARQHDMVTEVSDRLIDQLLTDWQRFREAGVELPVSINLPASLLAEAGSGADLALRTRRARMMLNQLAIEIREADLRVNSLEVMRTLVRLRIQGCQVTLDNYSGSASSLPEMFRFPVSEVKIATELCRRVIDDDEGQATISRLVDACIAHEAIPAAVGVESHSQLALFRALGVHRAQGHLIGVPKAFDASLLWLKQAPERLKSAGIDGISDVVRR